MKTLSLDLRERILSTYDKEEGTREQVARRFRVSLGMVKKLIQQRRHTGEIGSRRHLCGRNTKNCARDVMFTRIWPPAKSSVNNAG